MNIRLECLRWIVTQSVGFIPRLKARVFSSRFITFLYEVAFDDESVYYREAIRVEEPDLDDPARTASWHTLDELLAADTALYPEGVDRILRGDTTHVRSM